MKQLVILLLPVVLTLSACEVINPQEDIPAYIYIPDIEVNIAGPEQGTASDNLVDAWVFSDGEPIGTYELPARIPILKSGKTNLSIWGGIKLNGIGATRATYPLLRPHNTEVDLVPKMTDTILPSVTYFDSVSFVWNENFESAGLGFVKSGVSDTVMKNETNSNDVFEGSGAGRIDIVSPDTYFEASSTNAFELPAGQTPVFLELNYRCDHPFEVGLYIERFAFTDKVSIVTVNESPEWNKIYINLTPLTTGSAGALGFRIYFRAQRRDTSTSVNILLDNIKLLHQ